jgi:hypothetical protein
LSQRFLSVEEHGTRAAHLQRSGELYACRFNELRSLAIVDILEEAAMTRLTILSAAAALSMMAATPVFAMPAVQEPGAFAQYRPNANILNAGVRTPRPSLGALAFLPPGKSHAYGGHHKRRHVVRAGY